MIGRVFQERGEQVPVGTKVPPIDMLWETTPGVTEMREKFPAQYLIDRCEVSLRNLGVECLGVYYLHTWCPSWNEETEWYEVMQKLRDQGKIRGIGISVSDARPAEANGSIEAGASRCGPVDLQYPGSARSDRGVSCSAPAQRGDRGAGPAGFGGAGTPQTTFPPDDWRHDVFVGKTLERTLLYVDQLRFLAEGPVRSLPEAAIRFCISDPTVSSVIPGARSPQEAEENMRAWRQGSLPQEQLQQIQALWQRVFRHSIRTSFYPVTDA